MSLRYALGSIGAGNMAEGIIAAVIDRKVYPAEAIVVSDPLADRRRLFAERFRVTVTEDSRQVVADSQRIMFSVKPQSFDELAAGLAGTVDADRLLISIMAGKSTQRIAASLGGGSARVVRVMPNLPIRVGAGIAGIFAGEHATPEDVADVQAIFNAGGASIILHDEELMDAVTAVGGSGPAYFYYFVEAIVEGGKACGLNEHDALTLARHTCLGAARMMLDTQESPAELRRKVTSKGGTTQAALEHLNHLGVNKAIRDAVRAAFTRGRKLGSS